MRFHNFIEHGIVFDVLTVMTRLCRILVLKLSLFLCYHIKHSFTTPSI
jgi:hypothetical protein